MSGRRAAKIAFSLVLDLAGRLDAAGVTHETAPSLDEAMDMCWPLACQLARLEKTAKKAGRSAGRARAAVLDNAVAGWMARVQPSPVPAAGCGHGQPRWRKFDPAEWHVALRPGPAADREREVA